MICSALHIKLKTHLSNAPFVLLHKAQYFLYWHLKFGLHSSLWYLTFRNYWVKVRKMLLTNIICTITCIFLMHQLSYCHHLLLWFSTVEPTLCVTKAQSHSADFMTSLCNAAASLTASNEFMFMNSVPSVPFRVTWKMHFLITKFAN